MSILNQRSTATLINRYPEHFKEILNIIPDNNKLNILSFGCSTGCETNTLSDMYYKKSNIYGYDINNDVILNNIQNTDPQKNIKYFSLYKDLLNYKFDIIFCMSVLCVWPENKKDIY